MYRHNKISPLHKWIYNNKFNINDKNDNHSSTITHTSMDGGKYSIPKTHLREFCVKYAESIQKGFKLFLCEKIHDDKMNFFCDFDFKEEKEVSFDDIKDDIISLFKETVDITDDEQIILIVCASKPRKENGYVKSGFHLIWTGLYLTKNNCIYIRNKLCDLLNKKSSDKFKSNWNDIIDRSVYSTGLRMVGSLKKCKNKVIDSNYIPRYFIKHSNNSAATEREIKRAKSNLDGYTIEPIQHKLDAVLVEICSIHDIANANNISTIHENPDPESDAEIKKVKIKKSGIIVSDNNKDGSVSLASEQQVERRNNVYNYITKHLPSYWHNCRVGRVNENEKPGEYYVAIHDNNYCTNIGAEHNSVGVYFLINPDGLRQQCYCECNSVSKSSKTNSKTLCKHYTSNLYPLSRELHHYFYPDKKQSVKHKLKYEQSNHIFKTSDYSQLNNKNKKNNYLGAFDLTLENIMKKC